MHLEALRAVEEETRRQADFRWHPGPDFETEGRWQKGYWVGHDHGVDSASDFSSDDEEESDAESTAPLPSSLTTDSGLPMDFWIGIEGDSDRLITLPPDFPTMEEEQFDWSMMEVDSSPPSSLLSPSEEASTLRDAIREISNQSAILLDASSDHEMRGYGYNREGSSDGSLPNAVIGSPAEPSWSPEASAVDQDSQSALPPVQTTATVSSFRSVPTTPPSFDFSSSLLQQPSSSDNTFLSKSMLISPSSSGISPTTASPPTPSITVPPSTPKKILIQQPRGRRRTKRDANSNASSWSPLKRLGKALAPNRLGQGVTFAREDAPTHTFSRGIDAIPTWLSRNRDVSGSHSKQYEEDEGIVDDDVANEKRQQFQGDGSGPSNQGYPDCNHVGNNVLSCFPESSTEIVQDGWSKFIWNANYPTFIGAGAVDVYLYNADSETVAANFMNVANARGSIGIQPNFNWFPDEPTWNVGNNVSIPYYFVVVPAGSPVTGGEQHQATFTVVQTAPPPTLSASVASVSSASASAFSSASEASASSAAAATALSSGSTTVILSTSGSSVLSVTLTGSGTPTGPNSPGASGPSSTLQGDSKDSNDLPGWAIALIVIFGFLALLFLLAMVYFAIRVIRRHAERRNAAYNNSSGSTMNSATPMVQNRGPEGQGLLGSVAAGAAVAARTSGDREGEREIVPSDQDHHSSRHSRGSRDGGPFTGSDAAMMADAFRKALRQPEFVVDPSPGSTDNSNTNNNSNRLLEPPRRSASQAGIIEGGDNDEQHDTPSGNHDHDDDAPVLTTTEPETMASPQPDSASPAPDTDRSLAKTSRDSGGSVPPQIGHDDDGPEARELWEKELASEGRSVTSVRDRRRPEVMHSDE